MQINLQIKNMLIFKRLFDSVLPLCTKKEVENEVVSN